MIEYDRSSELENQLINLAPDIIFNCAAEIYDESKMYDSNVLLTQRILEHCRNRGTEHLIHFGSSAEYGRKSKPMSERDILEPQTLYEGTKAAATMLCRAYAHSFNVQVTVIRPFSVFGRHEKPHRLFPKLIEAFSKDIPMTLNEGYHDFIYIKDFVRGVNMILNSDRGRSKGDIVNLGSGKQYSNFEVLSFFEDIFNKKGRITANKNFAKPFESRDWVCDTSYAKEKYDFSTDFSLMGGILDLIKQYE